MRRAPTRPVLAASLLALRSPPPSRRAAGLAVAPAALRPWLAAIARPQPSPRATSASGRRPATSSCRTRACPGRGQRDRDQREARHDRGRRDHPLLLRRHEPRRPARGPERPRDTGRRAGSRVDVSDRDGYRLVTVLFRVRPVLRRSRRRSASRSTSRPASRDPPATSGSARRSPRSSPGRSATAGDPDRRAPAFDVDITGASSTGSKSAIGHPGVPRQTTTRSPGSPGSTPATTTGSPAEAPARRRRGGPRARLARGLALAAPGRAVLGDGHPRAHPPDRSAVAGRAAR